MTDSESTAAPAFDLLVVGAGFGGVATAYEARQRGLRARVLEQGSGVGGVWYWNRYPGARCDIESVDYSFSFSEEVQQEWTWSERYATQPEIERYLNFVVDRFGLRPDFQFDTRVAAATWDDEGQFWHVRTAAGETLTSRHLVMATGQLSASITPPFAGQDEFTGQTFHTGHWPKAGVDVRGKRVGVIGTGSSGVQVVPHLAADAAEVYVFQRTANHCVPALQGPLSEEQIREIKQNYPDRRKASRASGLGILLPGTGRNALDDTPDERELAYEANWGIGGFAFLATYNDISSDKAANNTAADFVAKKIRETVNDPEVAEKLTPTRDIHLGIKRIAVDTDYYASFNKPHVHLVDVRTDPIERLTPDGLRTAAATYQLDVVVFATGYDAMTGALLRIDIRGRGGVPLGEKWADGPGTYLGVMTSGFPNLFIVAGPGSPSVISNVVASCEHHAAWITRCISDLSAAGLQVIEAEAGPEAEWVQTVNEAADQTLFPTLDTWYTGSNVPGKPRIFTPYVGGVSLYMDRIEQVAEDGYPGFSRE